MDSPVTAYYQKQLNKCNISIGRYDALINRYSIFRLVIIAAGIFLFYQSLKVENSWLPVLVFFGVIFLFSLLVRKQNSFEKERKYFTSLARVYANEIGSISNRENMYKSGSEWIDDLHPYSSDLDIFGSRSLFELLNRCSTFSGNATLAGWLKTRGSAQAVRERQAAVDELASRQEWKSSFQAVLLFANQAKEDYVEKLICYLRLAPGGRRVVARLYIRWIPWLFLLSAALAWFYSGFILLVLMLGIANLFWVQAYSTMVMRTDALVGKMGGLLGRFSRAMQAIRSESWNSALCARLASALKDDHQDKLPGQLKRLAVRINLLSLGLSQIGPVLNFVMAWNVRQFFAIEDWKEANKINLEEAFDVIANFEALVSLSSLKSNYPDWTFPDIVEDDRYTLTAQAVGHPLIAPADRVTNEYSLDNELRIDIITGSNMAGKSTFLRTLGINAVLALAGAPVCAARMEISPMLVFSYMRIRDSLNESTSTFKAELDRLQNLLEILKTEDKVYFLIDEMLRGTNSADKYLGSKAVIEKLISQRAVGIIATHDLQIAELEQKYPDYIKNFYFDIEIDGTDMTFDYKLKEGECKTFNASILLKRLGIY